MTIKSTIIALLLGAVPGVHAESLTQSAAMGDQLAGVFANPLDSVR